MFDGMVSEYAATMERRMRDAVVFPRVDLIAPHMRELELQRGAGRQPRAARRQSAIHWLTGRFVGVRLLSPRHASGRKA